MYLKYLFLNFSIVKHIVKLYNTVKVKERR